MGSWIQPRVLYILITSLFDPITPPPYPHNGYPAPPVPRSPSPSLRPQVFLRLHPYRRRVGHPRSFSPLMAHGQGKRRLACPQNPIQLSEDPHARRVHRRRYALALFPYRPPELMFHLQGVAFFDTRFTQSVRLSSVMLTSPPSNHLVCSAMSKILSLRTHLHRRSSRRYFRYDYNKNFPL